MSMLRKPNLEDSLRKPRTTFVTIFSFLKGLLLGELLFDAIFFPLDMYKFCTNFDSNATKILSYQFYCYKTSPIHPKCSC